VVSDTACAAWSIEVVCRVAISCCATRRPVFRGTVKLTEKKVCVHLQDRSELFGKMKSARAGGVHSSESRG
jgi:hypothetical protein